MPLFVVATPIGNLSDLSARAIETLRTCDAVIAEDTRHTMGLLSHLGLRKPLLSLPAFDEAGRLGPIVAKLQAGETLALVTDAGTPGVSDPGALLVGAAWEAGVVPVPIPGPSAALTALSACGFDTARFLVWGFLPRKGESRKAALDAIKRTGACTVLFEAGNRTGDTLADLAQEFGGRRVLVARELTKLHEELVRGPLPEVAARFAEGARGEVVLVLEGGDADAEVVLPPVDQAIRDRLAAGDRVKDVAKAIAEAYGLTRSEAYSRVLAEKPADPEAAE